MNTTPIALSSIIKKWREEEGSRIPVVGKFLSHYRVRSGDKKKVQEFLLTDTIVRSHRLGTPPALVWRMHFRHATDLDLNFSLMLGYPSGGWDWTGILSQD
ncbi:hypothetical protein C1H46_002578 [Malus baccata]|uniref:Uncharacterized protein n=1 Tax=Malus baccata TaxID=106549 RepID=A0A540NL32_MALBA|nr:hypothetical protein C1H46_002578 [Malus baccata]